MVQQEKVKDELQKLEEWLTENGFQYERFDHDGTVEEPYLDRHQIVVFQQPGQKHDWDAICQHGSYGYSRGLLEISGSIVKESIGWGKTVEGYLTAEEIINRVKEKYARRGSFSC